MTEFNQIYINNIAEHVNNSVIDATSITPAEESTGTLDITINLRNLLIDHKNPYFILNGPCEWFESWSDSRINLKSQTVDFFLYEVLSVWQNHSRYNCPVGVIEEDCVISEFDMIDKWCEKHNCSYRILVNEYNMLDALQNTRYAGWPIIHCDSFSLGYYSKVDPPLTRNHYADIKYKLNCFTYRWDQHRMLACSLLHDNEHCVITHYHRTAGSFIKWPFNTSKNYMRLVNGKNSLNHKVPLTVEDFEIPAATMDNILPITKEHLTTDSLEPFYMSSFASLVCETNYEYPWGQISEKTINPLRFENAVILLAGPGSLKQLQSWGFRTFNQWWDESYDNEIDPLKRFDKVTDIVLHLLSLSIDELTEMKKQMADTLLYNRNHIRTGKVKKYIMKEIL